MVRTRSQAPTVSLLPSPPASPIRKTVLSGDGFLQLSLKGELFEHIPPDHSEGEQFPGKQPETTQLSLFDTGFRRKSAQFSRVEFLCV